MANLDYPKHWWIARDDTPGVQILSISYSFWENLAKSYVGAPLLRRWLVPPPRGNPKSATAKCIKN